MNPLGGTEIQYELLHKYVDNNLLDNFLITTSVPEKIPLIGFLIKIIITNMITMFLILIGVMKNLE